MKKLESERTQDLKAREQAKESEAKILTELRYARFRFWRVSMFAARVLSTPSSSFIPSVFLTATHPLRKSNIGCTDDFYNFDDDFYNLC